MFPFCVAEAACFSKNEQKLTLETPRCSQKEIELNFLSSEEILFRQSHPKCEARHES